MNNSLQLMPGSTVQGIFNELKGVIVNVGGGVSSDNDEWGKLVEICGAAETIGVYAQRCDAELWTDGEDQDSWAIVQTAAYNATQQSEVDGLNTILSGFMNITRPSRNESQWLALRQNADAFLDRLNLDPFHYVMKLVGTLAAGISTDAGEWGKYAEICADAAGSGIRTYIARCGSELSTTEEDQSSWTSVKSAAAAASAERSDDSAFGRVMLGFLAINAPSHNTEQWAQLRQQTLNMFLEYPSVQFNGTDTRARRLLRDPDSTPFEMSMSYLIRRDGFPAAYTEKFGFKTCHIEYFMRLDQTDATGSAYFIVTHSQDSGGYVALAKVPGPNVGPAPNDHRIVVAEPNFAGDVIWYDKLDGSHPGGCNHPGNGGQIGSKLVLVGQDWTSTIPVFGGHRVEPVGKGSKVLFYDFGLLSSGAVPSMGSGPDASNAFLGYITTQDLNIAPGYDGEVSSICVEQGPDGLFYLIAGNANQTVLWTSSELLPDISRWTQLPLWCNGQMDDGSSMLAWAEFGGAAQSLYYIKSRDDGMDFHPLKFLPINGKVAAVAMDGSVTHRTTQSSAFKGDGGWVQDNGSLYAGAGGGAALHGAYQSLNDSKGPPGQEAPCIQVRTWYSR